MPQATTNCHGECVTTKAREAARIRGAVHEATRKRDQTVRGTVLDPSPSYSCAQSGTTYLCFFRFGRRQLVNLFLNSALPPFRRQMPKVFSDGRFLPVRCLKELGFVHPSFIHLLHRRLPLVSIKLSLRVAKNKIRQGHVCTGKDRNTPNDTSAHDAGLWLAEKGNGANAWTLQLHLSDVVSDAVPAPVLIHQQLRVRSLQDPDKVCEWMSIEREAPRNQNSEEARAGGAGALPPPPPYQDHSHPWWGGLTGLMAWVCLTMFTMHVLRIG